MPRVLVARRGTILFGALYWVLHESVYAGQVYHPHYCSGAAFGPLSNRRQSERLLAAVGDDAAALIRAAGGEQ